jgi:cysteine desulfurase
VCVRDLGADLATISAHKMYGPKGAGALYVRRGTLLGRWMDGGSQERGLRAGTVNVPAVVGFGAACALLAGRREEDAERLGSMRDRFEAQIQARIPECRISGGDVQRLPGTSHVCLRGVEAEALLIGLDADGVYASGGAACSARSVVTSHVMRAMGIEDEWARGAVRFSMGRETTDEQLDYAVDALENALDDLRR